QGADAIQELSKLSLPFGVLRHALRLPPLKRAVDRGLSALVERRAELSAKLGVQHWVGVDKRSELPSRSKRFALTVASSVSHVVLVFFLVSCISQVLMENRAIPPALKPQERPEWMTAAVVYPR